ncbi:4-alpha-glucanotransferase [Angustibacter sp. Root456]|uniref:4-alpha-glucanotransferase n=1 Tax=Angustibacter sp. Root456 TaxID=1736539 RepID=UPI0006FDBE53|nr:4-alpha-glucanotransferase [Angustibacter sp. Root456]KQX65770.1 4-alpha-glucanotransferase [Angustibacter sp. Root456]
MTDDAQHAPTPSPALVALAREFGVATEYWNWQGEHVLVPATTIVAVLAALGVDASSDDAVQVALEQAEQRPWRRTLPPVVVTRAGTAPWVPVHLPHGGSVQAWAELERGGRRELTQQDHWVEPRVVDGAQVGEATFAVPADLPLGWHRLVARVEASGEATTASCPLVVTPQRLELPASLTGERRGWGFMTQLYSVRSSRSWGLGDLDDLAELAVWSASDLGADFVLVNPLHAAEPVGVMEPSPYLPTTRRFVNPIYIRVEAVPEVAYMPAAQRQLLEWQAESAQAANAVDALDRDACWTAKRSALQTVFELPRSAAREREFESFCVEQGQGLVDFATWCALAEEHGLPWGQWPVELHDPTSREVAAERERLAATVEFYRWLQWVADEQLSAAHRRAREAGMSLGVVHDLAVGVHPEGADAWGLGAALARGVSVGAPPDAFNQQGQDWSQPPWRPDMLAELGYAPYRDMLRTVLRHAGGVRVDHVLGLFRLWWVPDGCPPTEGTYVRYDHEALVGILALEAHRAGAVVVGEDLGVVEPWVRTYLRERGVFGTSILWFEKDDEGRPLPPEAWRELCLATVTTHDLPPTAGYLAGVHVDLREKLGLLTRPVEEEREIDEAERASVLSMLVERGLMSEGASERETVEALHRFLTWTPARLIGVSLADAVGDRRTINQPGTDEEYPNWRVPLADGSGTPVLLDDLPRARRARALARAVRPR